MFDPAALGTLLIGLDIVRQSEQQAGSPRSATPRRRWSLVVASRVLVARRRIAAARRHPRVAVDGSLVGT
jgi:hypothetical protein